MAGMKTTPGLKPQKPKRERLKLFPSNPDTIILENLSPHATPQEIKIQLDAIKRRDSGDNTFNSYNREMAWRIRLILKLTTEIAHSPRISKSKLCACLDLLAGLELERLDREGQMSQREYPQNPLWTGKFTVPQSTW